MQIRLLVGQLSSVVDGGLKQPPLRRSMATGVTLPIRAAAPGDSSEAERAALSPRVTVPLQRLAVEEHSTTLRPFWAGVDAAGGAAGLLVSLLRWCL
jgi:hypothetical protein